MFTDFPASIVFQMIDLVGCGDTAFPSIIR